jgi:hypothetical protein
MTMEQRREQQQRMDDFVARLTRVLTNGYPVARAA